MSYKHQAQALHHVLPPILGSLVELTPYQVRTFQKVVSVLPHIGWNWFSLLVLGFGASISLSPMCEVLIFEIFWTVFGWKPLFSLIRQFVSQFLGLVLGWPSIWLPLS